MDKLSWTDIRQALDTAAANLRKVDPPGPRTPSTVTSAALSLDPNQRRHVPDPDRLRELRHALAARRGSSSKMVDADTKF